MLVRFAPLIFLLLWSGGFSVAKVGIQYAEPLTLLALRYSCVVVLLLPFFLTVKPALPNGQAAWLHLCLVGFLMQCAYFGTAYIAFDLGVSAGGVAIITSLQPILVALVVPMLNQERVTPQRWTGLLLGLVGATIVITANSSIQLASFAGLAFAIVSLLSITLATLLEKRNGQEHHPLTSNLVQYVVGAACTLPIALWLEDNRIEWTLPFVAALTYLVVANSLVAISLLLMMIRRGEAARVSALFFLVPPVTALIAWFLLNERLAWLSWPGMALAAAGVWLAMRSSGPVAH